MSEVAERLMPALADRYRIERELAQGGMATVYLAQDVRHDRKVALKVLRPELAAVIGAERFLAEIKVTANLQHPHILPLHDSGEAGGFLFYVMPYVEGESLRDRLTREKQLPVDEAVRIAREVASALDYAHRHNVVHRDIKPENILLHDGQALVADFGIALAVSTAGGGTRMTETGMSLGTPHYMSPEQAMGEREITAKSDVYALGCVLYEMLTGEPPFTGPTAQAVVARVMTEAPRALTIQRRTVPPHVEAAVLTALEKLPADRFATAAAFADALASSGALATPPPAARTGAGVLQARRFSRVRAAAVVGVVALAAGVAAGRMIGPRWPARQVGRFVITTSAGERLTGAPVGTVALSPDGEVLVYVADNPRGMQLYLRRIGELTATPIPGTEGANSPFFSPDGRWIAFYAGTGLKKIALAGGAPVAIQGTSQAVQWAAWLDNERFLITAQNNALLVLEPDGTTRRLAVADSGEGGVLPLDVLPDGRTVLAIGATQGTQGRLVAIDARTGKRSVVIEGPIAGAAYDDGYLAWVQADGTLLGARFDTRHRRLEGSPVTIGQNVRLAIGGPAQFYVSRNRSLVYVPSLPFQLVLADRAGRTSVLTDERHRFHSPRFSPDGRRIAMDFTVQGSRDVWTLDLQQHTLSRLTFDNDGHDPVWTADGRNVAYGTARNGVIGIFERNADGSGAAESLLVVSSLMTAGAFTRDRGQAVGIQQGTGGSWDLVTIPLAGERKATPLLATPFNEGWPSLSPDGRWLAYQSDESGRAEVYVRPFPGPGGKILVSQNGGSEPVFSRDGRELFYRAFTQGAPLTAVTVQTSPEFRVVSRTTLFNTDIYEAASPHANYDVSPDGRSFVMISQGQLSEIVMVQNWTEEVRRRGAAGPR